ncbi:MAG: hypothetical protein GY930_18930 [bacterium]|nr:hypothetical protein [bacterium]
MISLTSTSSQARLHAGGKSEFWSVTPVQIGQDIDSRSGTCVFKCDANVLFGREDSELPAGQAQPIVLGLASTSITSGGWDNSQGRGLVLVPWDMSVNGSVSGRHASKLILVDSEMHTSQVTLPEGGIFSCFTGGRAFALGGEGHEGVDFFLIGGQYDSSEKRGRIGIFSLLNGRLAFTPFDCNELKAAYDPTDGDQKVYVDVKLCQGERGETYLAGVISLDGSCAWFLAPIHQLGAQREVPVKSLVGRSFLPRLVGNALNESAAGGADRFLIALRNPENLVSSSLGEVWNLWELKAQIPVELAQRGVELASDLEGHLAPGIHVGFGWFGGGGAEDQLFYASQWGFEGFRTKVREFSGAELFHLGPKSALVGGMEANLDPWNIATLHSKPGEVYWVSPTLRDYSDQDGHGSISFIRLQRRVREGDQSQPASPLNWQADRVGRVSARNYVPKRARLISY